MSFDALSSVSNLTNSLTMQETASKKKTSMDVATKPIEMPANDPAGVAKSQSVTEIQKAVQQTSQGAPVNKDAQSRINADAEAASEEEVEPSESRVAHLETQVKNVEEFTQMIETSRAYFDEASNQSASQPSAANEEFEASPVVEVAETASLEQAPTEMAQPEEQVVETHQEMNADVFNELE